MARVIDESFEGTGYEESWTETGTGTVNEDASIPGTAPPYAGSQCLYVVNSLAVDNVYAQRYVTGIGIAYARWYMYHDSNDVASGAYAFVSQLVDGSGSPLAYVGLYRSGATRYHGYRSLSTTGTGTSCGTVAYDTWYRMEVKWDYTNQTEEFRIDGTTKYSYSGSLITAAAGGFCFGNKTLYKTTYAAYYDLAALADDTWVGAETGGGIVLPVHMAQQRFRR